MLLALELTAVLGLTLAMLLTGVRLRGVLGTFLAVQGAYVALDFVARPIVLLLVQPAPRRNDPLADPRLAFLGYDDAMRQILPLVLLGFSIYLLTVLLFRRRRDNRGISVHVALEHSAALLALGWVFRLVYFVGFISATVETLAYVGSLGAGSAVLLRRQPLRPPIVLGLVLSELAWSVLYASKTPILALVLWLLIRLVMTGGFKVRSLLPTAVLGAAAFVAIQSVKVRSGRLATTQTYEDAYPPVFKPLLVVLQRFDGLQAVTDAVAGGAGSWMSPLVAGQTFLASLVPRFLLPYGKGDLSGLRWAAEVRRISLPGAKPSANLAEGPIAEGYVIGGLAGVAVESIIVGLVVLATVRMLQSTSRFPALLGLAITSQPLLFERGVLGIGEGIGKGLQIALASSLVLAVLDSLRRPAPCGLPGELPVGVV